MNIYYLLMIKERIVCACWALAHYKRQWWWYQRWETTSVVIINFYSLSPNLHTEKKKAKYGVKFVYDVWINATPIEPHFFVVVYCGPVLQLGLSTVHPQRYVSRQIRGKFIPRIWNFELKQQRVVGYMLHDCQVSQSAWRCSVIRAAWLGYLLKSIY